MAIDCPFCKKMCYLRTSNKVSPDPLRDLKRHITNEAKKEALELYLNDRLAHPHLKYYGQHAIERKVESTPKRIYDDDMTLDKK